MSPFLFYSLSNITSLSFFFPIPCWCLHVTSVLSLTLPCCASFVKTRSVESATSILRSNTNNHRRRSLLLRSRSRRRSRSDHRTVRQHRSTGHVRVSADDLRSLLDLLDLDGVVSNRARSRRGRRRRGRGCETASEVGRGGDGVGHDGHRRRRRRRGRGRGLEEGCGGLSRVGLARGAGEDEVGRGHCVKDGRLLVGLVERVYGLSVCSCSCTVCACCGTCCCTCSCTSGCSGCCSGCGVSECRVMVSESGVVISGLRVVISGLGVMVSGLGVTVASGTSSFVAVEFRG